MVTQGHQSDIVINFKVTQESPIHPGIIQKGMHDLDFLKSKIQSNKLLMHILS